MLTEQIIEFELRRPGPPGRTFPSTTGNFYKKSKISKANLRVDYYVVQKYCTRQCTLLPPKPRPNNLQNSTPKCKILKCLGPKF